MRRPWPTAGTMMLLAALAAALIACGGGADDDSAGGIEVHVHVHLDEWSVTPDPPSIPAGVNIAFQGHNHGRFPHRVDVIRTGLDPAELPLEHARVDLEAAGELVLSFEVPASDGDEGLQVGVADLSAGTYVVICNIPGHYQQGMRAAVTVN